MIPSIPPLTLNAADLLDYDSDKSFTNSDNDDDDGDIIELAPLAPSTTATTGTSKPSNGTRTQTEEVEGNVIELGHLSVVSAGQNGVKEDKGSDDDDDDDEEEEEGDVIDLTPAAPPTVSVSVSVPSALPSPAQAQQQPPPAPRTTQFSGTSTLSPSSAYLSRPPSATQQLPDPSVFKTPLPISRPASAQSDSHLNAFPMLGGPQRASSPSTPRKKVPLAPGHSPLDWARLLFSGRDLRGGVKQLARFTPSEVAQHRSRDDCWMAVQGNVYNVTHYIKFHPGGAGQLLRGAGKDATELFMKVHPWVNVDGLLGKCQVGYLVKEREGEVQEGKEGKDSLGV